MSHCVRGAAGVLSAEQLCSACIGPARWMRAQTFPRVSSAASFVVSNQRADTFDHGRSQYCAVSTALGRLNYYTGTAVSEVLVVFT